MLLRFVLWMLWFWGVVIVLPPRVLDECDFVCELFVNVILFESYLIVCELYVLQQICSIVCSTFHCVFWRMQIVFGICQVCFLSGVWFHWIVCSFWYLWCLYLQFMKCMVEIYAIQFSYLVFARFLLVSGICDRMFGICPFSFRNLRSYVWDLPVYSFRNLRL